MAILLVAACLVSPLAAVAQTPLTQLLDSTTLTMPVCKGREAGQPRTPVELKIPVRLSQEVKKKDDLVLQTVLVTLDGETRKPESFRFALVEIPAPGLGIVGVYIDPQLTETAGKYTVQVIAVRKSPSEAANPAPPSQPDPPRPAPSKGPPKPPAAGGTAAGGVAVNTAAAAVQATAGSLKFTFDRPAAELRLGPLRIIRQVRVPWFWSVLYPSTLLLSEIGGKSSVTPEPRELLIDLTLPDGQALPGRLKLSGLQTIDPWGQKEFPLDTEGSLDLGAAKGAITMRAPELASRKAEFQVEIVSRAWLGWLVVILVVSIFLGYVSRTVLDKRTRAIEALRAAQEQCGLLKELFDKTVDECFREKLKGCLGELDQVITNKPDDPDALNAATATARQKTTEILDQAKKLQADLAQKINEWQVTLESAGDQVPEIDVVIKETLKWLHGLKSTFEAGHLATVSTQLEQMKNKVGNIRAASKKWLAALGHSLALAKPWPETNWDDEFNNCRNNISELGKKCDKIDQPGTLGEFLQDLAKLRNDLFSFLYPGRWEAVKAVSGYVLAGLEKTNIIAPDELEEAQRKFGEALKAAGTADNLPQLMEAEEALWNSLKKTLNQAWKGQAGDLAGLNEGKFRQAWDQIETAKVSAEKAMGEEGEEEEAPSLEKELPVPQRPEPQPSPSPAWRVRIQGPALAVAGEALTLELVVTPPEGQTSPDAVVRWSVLGDPRFKWQSRMGEPWVFTPLETGRLVVRAEAEAPASGSRQAVIQTAELVISVMPAQGYAAAAELKKRLKRIETIQTLVYGFLITAVGYSIFQNSFTGAFDDILAAALWGYTLDIGVAKVREFATPLLAKAPKFPTA